MRYCLDFCTRPNVVLYVLKGNEKAAGFYRHTGFEPTGRIQLDHTPYGTLRDLDGRAWPGEKGELTNGNGTESSDCSWLGRIPR